MNTSPRSLLISVGSGGVGKTTLSAACGISAAQAGSKTLVITIDPAKRLAEALGVEGGMTEPTSVGDDGLSMMMLDMPKAWDDLIRRQYSDPDKIQAIFDNRFYHYLSRELAGSQELIAGEALLEIYQRKDFDLIVLDTPPSVHAIDFLDAPARIINFLANDTVVGVIERYGGRVSEKGSDWINKGGSILQSIVQKLVGKGFFMELVEFFVLLQDLIKPMVERTRAFEALVKSEATTFQIVTSTQPNAMHEAIVMRDALEERGYVLSRVLVNRVVPAFGCNDFPSPPVGEGRRDVIPTGRGGRFCDMSKAFPSPPVGEGRRDVIPTGRGGRVATDPIIQDHLAMVEEDQAALESLAKSMGSIAITPIEALPCDVHSAEGLERLVEMVAI